MVLRIVLISPRVQYVHHLPPSDRSRLAEAIVIVNPAITSRNAMTVKIRKTELPAHSNIIHDTMKPTNTKVDKMWSIIDTLDVRVDLNSSINRAISPSSITITAKFGSHSCPDGKLTENTVRFNSSGKIPIKKST